jgi:hypothetical protein
MSNVPPSPRMIELLDKAADAFIRNTHPFDGEWIKINEVTLNESVDLSELIGNILEEYVRDQKNMEGGDDC